MEIKPLEAPLIFTSFFKKIVIICLASVNKHGDRYTRVRDVEGVD